MLTSFSGSYLESTKETNQRTDKGYHEYAYGSKVLLFGTGVLLGVEHSKDHSPLITFKNAVALTLMNWVVWEMRYEYLKPEADTYNGWPFDGNWIDPQMTWVWDIGRFLMGFILYLM